MDRILTAWWRVFVYPASATFGDGRQIGIAVLVALALLLWIVGGMTKELVSARGDDGNSPRQDEARGT